MYSFTVFFNPETKEVITSGTMPTFDDASPLAILQDIFNFNRAIGETNMQLEILRSMINVAVKQNQHTLSAILMSQLNNLTDSEPVVQPLSVFGLPQLGVRGE